MLKPSSSWWPFCGVCFRPSGAGSAETSESWGLRPRLHASAPPGLNPSIYLLWAVLAASVSAEFTPFGQSLISNGGFEHGSSLTTRTPDHWHPGRPEWQAAFVLFPLKDAGGEAFAAIHLRGKWDGSDWVTGPFPLWPGGKGEVDLKVSVPEPAAKLELILEGVSTWPVSNQSGTYKFVVPAKYPPGKDALLRLKDFKGATKPGAIENLQLRILTVAGGGMTEFAKEHGHAVWGRDGKDGDHTISAVAPAPWNHAAWHSSAFLLKPSTAYRLAFDYRSTALVRKAIGLTPGGNWSLPATGGRWSHREFRVVTPDTAKTARAIIQNASFGNPTAAGDWNTSHITFKKVSLLESPAKEQPFYKLFEKAREAAGMLDLAARPIKSGDDPVTWTRSEVLKQVGALEKKVQAMVASYPPKDPQETLALIGEAQAVFDKIRGRPYCLWLPDLSSGFPLNAFPNSSRSVLVAPDVGGAGAPVDQFDPLKEEAKIEEGIETADIGGMQVSANDQGDIRIRAPKEEPVSFAVGFTNYTAEALSYVAQVEGEIKLEYLKGRGKLLPGKKQPATIPVEGELQEVVFSEGETTFLWITCNTGGSLDLISMMKNHGHISAKIIWK